jgi:hypothetical protein
MYRLVTTYQSIKRSASKQGFCPVCGKRTTRRTTFEQTLNPYNINKETRFPKTYSEISDELNAAVKDWKENADLDFRHYGCRETLDESTV